MQLWLPLLVAEAPFYKIGPSYQHDGLYLHALLSPHNVAAYRGLQCMLAQAAASNYQLRSSELLVSRSLLCLSAQRLNTRYASRSCLSRFMTYHVTDLLAEGITE